jgi:hypothetical protein
VGLAYRLRTSPSEIMSWPAEDVEDLLTFERLKDKKLRGEI